MRLVSLDTSTQKSGCALFVDGELSDHCLIDMHKEKDSEERMNRMCVALVKKLNVWKPDTIWIEAPEGTGGNIKTYNMLSEIIGAVRLYAAVRGCEFNEIKPPQWRKWLGFDQAKKRRADLKQMSMDYVLDNYGIDCNSDEADSICIGLGVIAEFDKREG